MLEPPMIDRDTVIQWAISVGYPGVNEYGAAPDFVAALPSLMAVAQKAVEGGARGVHQSG